MSPESFNQINVHIPITPMLLFAIAALILAGWLIFTLIVRYHWKNYSVGGVQIFAMNFFYLVGSAVIGGLMILSALAYQASSL